MAIAPPENAAPKLSVNNLNFYSNPEVDKALVGYEQKRSRQRAVN